MNGDVQQAALPRSGDLGQPADRAWIQLTVLDDPQSARTFGDQDTAIRQKCETPGVLQAIGDFDDPESLVAAYGRFQGLCTGSNT